MSPRPDKPFGQAAHRIILGACISPADFQHRTRSLTRKSAVVLAAMAGSAVSGWRRPLAMRVVVGPGEAIDTAQFTEPLDPAEPDIGYLAPSFCGQYPPERNALSIAVPHHVSSVSVDPQLPTDLTGMSDQTSFSNRRLFAC